MSWWAEVWAVVVALQINDALNGAAYERWQRWRKQPQAGCQHRWEMRDIANGLEGPWCRACGANGPMRDKATKQPCSHVWRENMDAAVDATGRVWQLCDRCGVLPR